MLSSSSFLKSDDYLSSQTLRFPSLSQSYETVIRHQYSKRITATRYVIMTTNAAIKSSFYLKLLMKPPLALPPPPKKRAFSSVILEYLVQKSSTFLSPTFVEISEALLILSFVSNTLLNNDQGQGLSGDPTQLETFLIKFLHLKCKCFKDDQIKLINKVYLITNMFFKFFSFSYVK